MADSRYRIAVSELRSAQKPTRGASAYSIRVNRPLGRRLAAMASVLGLTPTQVSVLSAGLSLVGIGLLTFLRPSPALGLFVGGALVGGFALDSADGQLARLQGTSTRAGEWVDHMVDCLVKLLLHIGVLVSWYHVHRDPHLLLIPLAFQVVAVLTFFGGVLVEKLRTTQAPPPHGLRGRPGLLLPVDNGVLCCSFFVWGIPTAFVWLYSVLFLTHLLYLAAFLRNWYGDLR